MARSSLPPGFRFHPTDVELILYYLKRKVLGKKLTIDAIPELDLYKFAPWDLPDKSILRSRDLEWYFFCAKDRKYSQGARTNRATDIGYWKATGKDRPICNVSQTVGMKKTLIFHLKKASKGERTNWVMHEYRLEIKDWNHTGISQDSYVLCKIFEKSGVGPKNGEQHGAPFNEEEWDDDNDNEMENNFATDFPSIILDAGKRTAQESSTIVHKETTTHQSSLQPSCQNASPDGVNNLFDGVDIDALLALLDKENDPFPGNDVNERPEWLNYDVSTEVADGNDIFGGLEDINSGNKLLKGIDNLDFVNDMGFMEMDDFNHPMKYHLEMESGSSGYKDDVHIPDGGNDRGIQHCDVKAEVTALRTLCYSVVCVWFGLLQQHCVTFIYILLG